MIMSRAASPDEGALTPVDQNPHYVRAVTEFGERNEVVAHEDIYAANGMKLLAKGARIDRSKWEHLTEHKLKIPLDLMLVADDAIDAVALANEADKLVAADPILSRMGIRSGDPQGFKFSLGRLSLPDPIAFRLSVMRHDRHDLYQHSLRTAIIAHSFAVRLELPEAQKEHLLFAALCHDIGEMHTDPALLAPERHIGDDERGYIYVHPITGYVVLQQLGVLAGDVVQAVLQHHERLDGSGYPYGLAGAQTGRFARIIAVAETHEVVIRRFDLGRLDVILRLNQSRLDESVVNASRELVQIDHHLNDGAAQQFDAVRHLSRLSNVFRTWSGLRTEIESEPASEPLRFISPRMATLQSLAFQAGLEPSLLNVLDLAGEDAAILSELLAATDEMDRLLEDLAYEIERRTLAIPSCHTRAHQIVELLRTR